ncbi:hypothetical protein [Cohnella mopanensis]|uniref:hypothetical protein n=1 Tax=Cohnella mopanensis TaxID=2911966 RepID=UPI001EF8B35C|nr:hypothetical protein [Cohnella mopanensis]
MKYQQLNNGWGAEPNAPDPQIEIDFAQGKLKLKFYLNPFIYKDVEEEIRAELEFSNCFMFRLGPTNDEGFYRGQCRFSKTGINWGEFYQLEETEWKETFPKDKVIVLNHLINEEGLRHYLFYFRDVTFECIAKDYHYKNLNDYSK